MKRPAHTAATSLIQDLAPRTSQAGVMSREMIRHGQALIVAACLGACSAQDGSSVEAVTADASESAGPYEAANALMALEWTDENLSYVRSVLDGAVVNEALRANPALDDEAVRITAASILAQATRHCSYSGDLNELHEYMKRRMEHPDQRIQNTAILLVGLAGFDSDLPLLELIVREESPGRAENAATSISFMFTQRATASLESLRDEVRRESLRKFIGELLDKGPVHPGRKRATHRSCDADAGPK